MIEAARRLDIRVLIVHTVTFRQARGVLSGAGPAALLLGTRRGIGTTGVIAIAVAATLASLVFATLRWWRFSYEIDGERLVVSQGVFNRSQRAVPLDRIRGVDVEAPLLHRLFGVVILRADAAAGAAGRDEATLDAVSAADGEQIRTLLLARAGGPGAPLEQPTTVAPDRVLARLDPRWLLYAPLVGGYLAVPLALGGTLLRQVEDLPLPRGIRQFLSLPDEPDPARIAGTALVVLLLVVVGAVLAGGVTNWGFVLVARGRTLVAERGLFTRRSVALEIDRIRGYVVSDGPGLRLVRAARLTALVTGLGDQARRGQLLPLGPRRVVWAVAAAAVTPLHPPLLSHPVAALRRRLVRATALPLLAAVLLAALGQVGPAVGALALAGAAVLLGWDRYRSLGHAADEAVLSVRAGSLVRRQAILERRAIVGWQVRQSFFQRRSGLVTMTACVGAGQGGYDVLDCAAEQAAALIGAVSPGWAQPLAAAAAP